MLLPSGCASNASQMYSAPFFAEQFSIASDNQLGVCRSSAIAANANLGSINTVVDRREMLRLASDETCTLTLLQAPAQFSLPEVATSNGCYFAFEAAGSEVSRVELAPVEFGATSQEKCVFRLMLWVADQDELFASPDENVFLPLAETRWWGYSSMPSLIPNYDFHGR